MTARLRYQWLSRAERKTHHENDSGSRGKHVLAANRTITLQITFNTLVSSLQTHRHTNITRFAMEIVDSEAFPDTTNTTVVAVINIFSWVVIPQFTFRAIVLGDTGLALDAVLGGWLDGLTFHAHHGCCEVTDDVVIWYFVVTESTGEPTTATMSLQFTFSLVVLAS